MKTSVFIQIRCYFPNILYLSETQKNNFQFLRRREFVVLLKQHSLLYVVAIVIWCLFLMVPQAYLWCVIVTYPGYTHPLEMSAERRHEISNSGIWQNLMQPLLKRRNVKRFWVSSLTVIKYSSDFQRLWPDCAYVQADLRLCWSHMYTTLLEISWTARCNTKYSNKYCIVIA